MMQIWNSECTELGFSSHQSINTVHSGMREEWIC